MKEFFVKLLKLFSQVLGIALCLTGIGLLIGFAYEFPNHDTDILIGLAFTAALSLLLGFILLRLGTMADLTCKAVGTILLAALGIIFQLIATGLAFGLYYDLKKEGPGFSIFFLLTFVFIPAILGYFLFRIAGNMQESPTDRQRSRVRLYLLGQVMALCFVLAIAVYLPTMGRIVIALLLMLLFARVHRGWSSRRFRMFGGATSYAEIFDFIVQGTLYLVVWLLMMVLTGGRGGVGSFGGGGGSSGGGGASGKW